MSPPTRPASRAEIVSYLGRIHHPLAADDETSLAAAVRQEPLRILQELMHAHTLFIPFENTFMHCESLFPEHIDFDGCLMDYALSPTGVDTVTSPPLDPCAVQSRLVARHLGGYCYFHALQLSRILLGLGYTCRPVSAFVRESSEPSINQPRIPLPKRATHCCILLELDDKQYLVDCGFSRRGPLTPIPLPESQQVGQQGEIAGSSALSTETWRITVADLSVLSQPDDAENGLPNPTYLLHHRSLRKGQTEQDVPWDVLYAFTTETQDLETYEKLSWHVCIGEKGISHKFREYFTVSRTYQPGHNGPEYPREGATNGGNGNSSGSSMDPCVVDFTAKLARISLTNMQLSIFEAGEKKVLCEFTSEQERLEGLTKWFGLKSPFDGELLT